MLLWATGTLKALELDATRTFEHGVRVGLKAVELFEFGESKPVRCWDPTLILQSQGTTFLQEFSNVSVTMSLSDSRRSFVNKGIG